MVLIRLMASSLGFQLQLPQCGLPPPRPATTAAQWQPRLLGLLMCVVLVRCLCEFVVACVVYVCVYCMCVCVLCVMCAVLQARRRATQSLVYVNFWLCSCFLLSCCNLLHVTGYTERKTPILPFNRQLSCSLSLNVSYKLTR